MSSILKGLSISSIMEEDENKFSLHVNVSINIELKSDKNDQIEWIDNAIKALKTERFKIKNNKKRAEPFREQP